MVKFKVEKEGKAGVVVMEGDCTIEQASELRDSLKEAIQGVQEVFVDAENVTAADLTCLQLLCSAHRTALKMKRRLALRAEAPQVFKDSVLEAGFDRHQGCEFDRDGSCLWLGWRRR